MEDLLNEKEQTQRVVDAIRSLKPGSNRIDAMTYSRIVDDDLNFVDDTRSAYSRNHPRTYKARAVHAQPGGQNVDEIVKNLPNHGQLLSQASPVASGLRAPSGGYYSPKYPDQFSNDVRSENHQDRRPTGAFQERLLDG